jgi:hypothetical protein
VIELLGVDNSKITLRVLINNAIKVCVHDILTMFLAECKTKLMQGSSPKYGTVGSHNED